MFQANPWGLYDIIGNADEFVADCDHKNGYQDAPKNQEPWLKNCGEHPMYIRRGGAAMENIDHLTVRGHMGGGFGTVHAGFRVALDLSNNDTCLTKKGHCAVNQATQDFREQLNAAQIIETFKPKLF
jgi:hypothetical protein